MNDSKHYHYETDDPIKCESCGVIKPAENLTCNDNRTLVTECCQSDLWTEIKSKDIRTNAGTVIAVLLLLGLFSFFDDFDIDGPECIIYTCTQVAMNSVSLKEKER